MTVYKKYYKGALDGQEVRAIYFTKAMYYILMNLQDCHFTVLQTF